MKLKQIVMIVLLVLALVLTAKAALGDSTGILDVSATVGNDQNALVAISNNEQTTAFHPGDTIYFQFDIKNSLNSSDALGNTMDLGNTMENVQLIGSSDLVGFPQSLNTYFDRTPLYLRPAELLTSTIVSYTIPLDTEARLHPIAIRLSARDLQNPANSYQTTVAFNLNVSRDNHQITIVNPIQFTANPTCAQKQTNNNVVVTLANIGSTSEPVTVKLSSGSSFTTSIIFSMLAPVTIFKKAFSPSPTTI